MAKNTWVNVAGTWKAMKNVWVNVNGTWKSQVVPKGNISGVWKEFIQYLRMLYKAGIEYTPWVAGYKVGNGNVYKNSDSIYIKCGGEQDNYITVVTDSPVNLSSFKTLESEVRLYGYNNYNYWILITKVKNGKEADATKYIKMTTNVGGQYPGNTIFVQSLDISDLNGDYYIAYQTKYNGEINLYRSELK